jgi:hypothetical protein
VAFKADGTIQVLLIGVTGSAMYRALAFGICWGILPAVAAAAGLKHGYARSHHDRPMGALPAAIACCSMRPVLLVLLLVLLLLVQL